MQAVMIVVALGFASMGVAALVRPSLIPAQFGTSAETSDARTEVRAVYGGFGVAMAVLLVVAALRADGPRDGVSLTVGIALGGMAAGRLIGMAIELAILSAFVPLKFLFALCGRFLDALVNLPFRLLGLAVKLVVVAVGFFFLFFFLQLSFRLLFGILR